MKQNLIFWLGIYFLLTIGIFSNIFSYSQIAGGDYIPLWPAHIEYFRMYAFSSWDSNINLGWSSIGLLHYAPFSYVIGLFGSIVKDSVINERVFWWIPFITLTTFSISYLFIKIFNEKKFWILAPFIYLFNTYILMVIGGGQIAGIGLGYSIAPLIFLYAIQLTDSETSLRFKLRDSFILGLLLSLQLMFDLRVVYITLLGVGLYFLFSLLFSVRRLINVFWVFVLPGLVTLLLHAFWILPLLAVRQNPIQQFGQSHTSLEAVKYFSFAFFENTFSLLYPYWPENIFGKVGFMRAEFLVLPLVAFSSLLFVSSKAQKNAEQYAEQRRILFFALLGLVGAFLAKGANDPLGGIYVWMFDHVPGFVMFRDSMKWYLLLAISYSVLIPFSIYSIYNWLKEQRKYQIANIKYQINYKNKIFNLSNVFLLFTILFLLFLIRPALLGQLNGTFKRTEIPSEYLKLNTYLNNDHEFGRTLWIPTFSRFADYKMNHPVVFGPDFLHITGPASMSAKLALSEEITQNAAISYVIVPYDPLGELFLEDRKYDEKQYKDTIRSLEKIPWLQRVTGFEKIGVFRVDSAKRHFWSPTATLQIDYEMVSPTHYNVKVENAKEGDEVIFAERFDRNWVAKIEEKEIPSTSSENQFNSYALPRDGNYQIEVYYTPDTLVHRYLVVSNASLLVILVVLGVLFYTKSSKVTGSKK